MQIHPHLFKFFTETLARWDINHNRRPMPWKGESDAYKVWLSEIILQQTRVEQGLPYYNRFIIKYPSIQALANADDTEVFKMWEGLGYYSRCRNLLETARTIRDVHNNEFPGDHQTIRKLKGIGDYTAAAIASFAFNSPHAVVDGNVSRVLSRFFGIKTPVDSSEGKKQFAQLASGLLNLKEPGKHNQALMDFGAMICKPRQPECETCPFRNECVAYNTKTVDQLPVKKKAAAKVNRQFFYFVMHYNNKVYVRKRVEKGIWQNLYEFVLWEPEIELQPAEQTGQNFLEKFGLRNYGEVIKISDLQKQVLSHQVLHAKFVTISLQREWKHANGYELIDRKQLSALPFPKLITAFLKDKNVSLNLF